MYSEVSYLRIWATLTVVLCHCFGFYGAWPNYYPDGIDFGIGRERNLICDIALYVFVFVSGYLYAKLYTEKGRYHDTKSFVIGKINRLIRPYFFWSVVSIICMQSTDVVELLFTGCHHLWFLMMLFGIFCLIRFVDISRLTWKNGLGGGNFINSYGTRIIPLTNWRS